MRYDRSVRQRGAVRARSQAEDRAQGWVVIVAMALTLLVGIMGMARAQSVPEVVKPRIDSPALPSTEGKALPQPRSENPLAPNGAAKPVPDPGVVAGTQEQPQSAVIKPPVIGTMPVIPPPSTGGMPVIPPPGTLGGERGVQPK